MVPVFEGWPFSSYLLQCVVWILDSLLTPRHVISCFVAGIAARVWILCGASVGACGGGANVRANAGRARRCPGSCGCLSEVRKTNRGEPTTERFLPLLEEASKAGQECFACVVSHGVICVPSSSVSPVASICLVICTEPIPHHPPVLVRLLKWCLSGARWQALCCAHGEAGACGG